MTTAALALAHRLQNVGLTWNPAPGDRFVIPNRGMDDEVFVLSTMTIEVREIHGQQTISFNGTTEWALDDVEAEATIWLPREDQLRNRLGAALHRLERTDNGWRVVATIWGEEVTFDNFDPELAYGEALVHLLTAGDATPRA